MDVLDPLIEDRDEIKAKLRETDDEDRRQVLKGQSNAIKWILVSCFGYQGFSNAKFGRIECQEAINAFAREILLDAKAILEEHGWRDVHGIVDSIWVTDDDAQSHDRVELAVENPSEYDTEFYRELVVRAAASVLSPLGWRTNRIEQYLADHTDASLQSFL